MRTFLLKVLAGTVLMAFVVFCDGASVDAAQITRTLDENTRITPPGFIVAARAEIPMFKKGTTVTLNEFGEVIEGILAEGISLPYETGTAQDAVRTSYAPPPVIYVPTYLDTGPKYRILPFKGGTKVAFNNKGEVIFGTINGSNESIVLNYTNHISVSEGEISFHRNGMVAACTLAGDAYLRPVGWQQFITDNFTENTACPGFVEFKGGKQIKLNEKGEVVRGTLDKDTKLPGSNAFLTDVVARKLYEAGTTVEFDNKGVVVKASK